MLELFLSGPGKNMQLELNADKQALILAATQLSTYV